MLLFQIIQHKINHLKAYNSTALVHLQSSSLPSVKIAHHPQRKPPSSSAVTSYSPSLQILAIHLWIYLVWIFHRDGITQGVASSSYHRVFKVPPHCSTYWYFTSLSVCPVSIPCFCGNRTWILFWTFTLNSQFTWFDSPPAPGVGTRLGLINQGIPPAWLP